MKYYNVTIVIRSSFLRTEETHCFTLRFQLKTTWNYAKFKFSARNFNLHRKTIA